MRAVALKPYQRCPRPTLTITEVQVEPSSAASPFPPNPNLVTPPPPPFPHNMPARWQRPPFIPKKNKWVEREGEGGGHLRAAKSLGAVHLSMHCAARE